jgi:cytochrome b6-f complex iron-sulfur subunit
MTAIVVIAIVLIVLFAAGLVFASLRRRDAEQAVGHLSRETRARDLKAPSAAADLAKPATGREVEVAAALEARDGGQLVAAGSNAPVEWVPPDPEALGMARRQFLNRGIIAGFGISLAGFGASLLAYLWPQVSGGFGTTINVGKVTDINAQIQAGDGFYYFPAGLMWITNYPAYALPKAKKQYSAAELAGMENGLVALYQKCVHLGCRVPQCVTSQWFECPCHGSKYNQVGEKKAGPAPRGLDRFAMNVSGGQFSVNTGLIILGPPIGTNTTGQEAEGPHCVNGGAA